MVVVPNCTKKVVNMVKIATLRPFSCIIETTNTDKNVIVTMITTKGFERKFQNFLRIS